MTASARVLLALIRAYQRAFGARPSPCRFVPSCSNYGVEAITVHGAPRGVWLTARRLARCHPWGQAGFDPVPSSVDRRSPAPANPGAP